MANITYAIIERNQYLLTSEEFRLNAQLNMEKNNNKAEQTIHGKNGSSLKTPNFSKATPPPIQITMIINIDPNCTNGFART